MANSFTPQEIEQFLQQFFDTVGARQYIGARYVPIFGRAGEGTMEWDDLAPYEPLTVVMHQGVSYVSRRYVPTGIPIDDTAYWVETYRFDAQVEQYRQQVLTFQAQIDDKVPYPVPDHSRLGTPGQVLSTLGDGATEWADPVVPSEEQAEAVITQWLDDHPEATTTVLDGSITTAKLRDGAVTDEKLAPNGIIATAQATGRTADALVEMMRSVGGALADEYHVSLQSTTPAYRYRRFAFANVRTYVIVTTVTNATVNIYGCPVNAVADGELIASHPFAEGPVTYYDAFAPSGDWESICLRLSGPSGTQSANVSIYEIAVDKGRLLAALVPTANLYDEARATPNAYIDQTTGELVSNNQYKASAHIQVTPGVTYQVSTTTTTSPSGTRIAFYDANFTFISGSVSVAEAAAPTGAAYMRFSIYQSRENVMCVALPYTGEYVPYGANVDASTVTAQVVDALMVKATNDGSVGRGAEIAPDIATYSSTDGATYDGTGWNLAEGQSIQTAITVTADTPYLVMWYIDNVHYTQHMPNSITVALGSDSARAFWAPDSTNRAVLTPASSGTTTLKLTMAPTAYGRITNVSVRPVANTVAALMLANGVPLYAYAGNLGLGGGLSASFSNNNTAYGTDAQMALDAGQNNVAVGFKAQEALRCGSYNTAFGNRAQAALTSGMYNVGLGQLAQYNLTEGCWNNAMGNEAQRDITTGCNNVSLGRRAHNSITTGSNNTAVGAQAGYINEGDQGTDNMTTTGSYQTTVGFNATQKAVAGRQQFDYATAFGAHARAGEYASALGPNTAALGAGSVAIGCDSQGNGAVASADDTVSIGTASHSIVLSGHVIVFNSDGTVTWTEA